MHVLVCTRIIVLAGVQLQFFGPTSQPTGVQISVPIGPYHFYIKNCMEYVSTISAKYIPFVNYSYIDFFSNISVAPLDTQFPPVSLCASTTPC